MRSSMLGSNSTCSSTRARRTALPGPGPACISLPGSDHTSTASFWARSSALKNQTISLGDFELTVLTDGTYVADGGAFFGIIPKVMWQKKVQADELNRITVSCNSVLVRTGKQNVLIETGIGNKLEEKRKKIFETQEKLLDNLQTTGVSPNKIDIVINSHLHFYHCGWNTVYRNGPAVATFPSAKYFPPKADSNHESFHLNPTP